jgi:chromosome partitioning protein
MGQILAIVSSKGGVGKTTTAVNLAAAFASLDFPTLLVEADPQCSLVTNFGFDRFDIPKGLFDVARGEARLEETTFETPVPSLHVVSSNIWSQEEELAYLKALEQDPLVLRRAAEFLKAGYDYIVIDAPPMLGPITIAVLAAADRFIVPVQAEPHAVRSLQRLMGAANKVRNDHNPDLTFDGVALTMVDSRTRMSTEIAATIRTAWPNQVFSSTIPRSVRLAEVPATGRPVAVSAPSSRGGRGYAMLAEEILLIHARERVIEKSQVFEGVDETVLNDAPPTEEEELALALLREQTSGRGDRSGGSGVRASGGPVESWDERIGDVLIEVEAGPAHKGNGEGDGWGDE